MKTMKMTFKDWIEMSMKTLLPLKAGACAVLTLWPLAPAMAADIPPDAGRTLREIQGRPDNQPPAAIPAPLQLEGTDKAAGDSGGLKVLVKSFRVQGSTVFPASELEGLFTALKGSELSLDQLSEAARTITRYYRKHGYSVARAYLPAQKVEGGEILIQVLEGRLSRIDLKNDSRVSDEQLGALIDGRLRAGQLLDKEKVNQALLLMNDLPGVGRVQGALRPGSELGTTDLVVSVPAGKAWQADVSLDNTGSRFTGQYRLGGHLVLNNPLGSGDRLDLRATLSDEALAYGRLQWDVPVGTSGLRVGANAGYSRYELGDRFKALDAHGNATTLGVTASMPLVLAVERQIRAELTMEHRSLNDVVGTTQDNDKDIASAAIALAGSHADGRWSGGWRAEGTFGSLDIRTPIALTADRNSARTNGSYRKAVFSGNLMRSLGEKSGLLLLASTQFAGKNLDSSEKFMLGGAGGVRAYPSGEGLGDNGWLATLEYRYRLLPSLQGTLFFDAGGVDINHSPFAAGDNSRQLTGQGFGLNANPVPALNLKMSVAWRGHEQPLSDKDQQPRMWLQAGYRF